MSILETQDCYRPQRGVRGWIGGRFIAWAPALLGLLRRWKPILHLFSTWVVTRYDDVVEIFETDAAFGVTYAENLDVITDKQPFFLGMRDTADYRRQLAGMRTVCTAADLHRLADDAEARAQAMVDATDGRIEVVGLVRPAAFDTIARYFGVPEPAVGSLSVWGSRLFEFQFTGSPADKVWLADVEQIAAAFRVHIDGVIAARKAKVDRPDDVLSRCLTLQAQGAAGYSDVEIRTALLCMIVGGPPQPPMVLPQALEQLLRRPAWLAVAQQAARAGDDGRLWAIIQEAMRFDPLGPGLKRIALQDWTLARGTSSARTITKGSNVVAAFSSAMMDARRIPDPKRFDPDRQPHEYVHFGHGLHICFGLQINKATMPRMLKPLLARQNLRRARGSAGHLRKNGLFSDRLVVEFD
ncbi:cytochrome P450 [Allosphingosinicella deserti]|uniref:Cytochrome P450 n=1 Tax=Allosphingosinicella deserti TaxID=2116704 RepID=A0A2P7QSG7_9SPHN|nr:cytochrome P450 [Sphingomonas deserti]PSJ40903.1 cytochrome P450 [Sphingomonas deserti]